ncbi:transcriptional regulator [Paraburkholderia caribensis]|uniref:transcriptional regulator n=1 Tax=Paraburkholderia caribensis TaxID=75105 RepID=UPI0028633BB0|nr:YdaS family helix-turn-helix protein [Paraburkholderia caribensis]MDR6381798.1 DNA-binding transcriptional regulator YdaS (Cro superfamily) [Paraburkholderia caribensis]
MNLKAYISKERGRLTALSKAIGAHAPDVSRWADGKRPVPIQFGLPIEQATNGEVTRLEMFPIEVVAKVWPDLLKGKNGTVDRAAASDDTQPPVGGSNPNIKEARTVS